MQLSCLPVSFFSAIIQGQMSVADWARIGAATGLDAIDLSILFMPGHSLATARVLRSQIEAAGMRVAMLATYPDFTHPDPAVRERELALAEAAITVAVELGADLVRVTAGQAHPEMTREDGIASAVEGLARLLQDTLTSGVTLVYENHSKPGAWRYTDFSESPDIFLEIARATEGLGINFDTANATAFAEDPVKLLEQVVHRVVSVHASDTATRGALRPVLLGTGVTPFEKLFTCLKQSGWDGWICMEEASHQGVKAVKTAAQYVRRVWNEA